MSTKDFEDVYPLSPMQEGMLFHTLSMPETSVYIEQTILELRGQLQVNALKAAWERVINHHTILQTAFVWEGFDQPLQVVRPQVKLPWLYQDWTTYLQHQQEKKLESFLEKDRQKGFELADAPLLRVALFRLTPKLHRLVLTNHHILLDGWSLPLLLRDLFTLYADPAATLLPSRPFKDYIAWLQAQDPTQAERFWKEQLKGFQAPLSLAFNKPAAAPHSPLFTPAVHAAVPLAPLQECVQQEQLTLNTFVHGAWATLLTYYAGTTDILFGTTVSGRPHTLANSADMVGLFINTLPTRIQVEIEQPLQQWLHQLQNQLLLYRDHEHSSLVDIHGWSEIPRLQSLFESILIFENSPGLKMLESEGELQVGFIKGIEKTNYPLTLAITPLGSELKLRLEYDSDRFSAADMQQMVERLGQLLLQLPDMLYRPVQSWSPHTPAEKEQLQRLQTSAPAKAYQSILDQFIAQSQTTPDKAALVWEIDHQPFSLTYQQLNEQSNQLAHYLIYHGLRPGGVVAIHLNRSYQTVITMLAVLKTGAAFVILEPTHPQQRNAFMLAETGVNFLITQKTVDSLANDVVFPLYLEDHQPWIDQQSTKDTNFQPSPADLAYIIYTSGTTGKPKGVPVTHGNLFQTLSASQTQFSFSNHDVMLCLAAFSFDISLLELFCPLLSGGTAHLLISEQIFDLTLINQVLPKATALHAVPSLMGQIVDYIQASEDSQPFLNLTRLFVGGEAVPPELLKRMQAVFPQATIHVLYGPTEATIICSSYTLSPGESVIGHLIGSPLPGATLRIYTNGQQTPLGLPGELYIAGPGVVQGYWRQPELSQSRFVHLDDHTFYRTGDLVRYQADSAAPTPPIEFLGRLDQQLKIRGVRIEPGEIERILLQYSDIKEALITAYTGEDGEKQLIAYLIPAANNTFTLHAMRQRLYKQLPAYMIPSNFITLEAFPLTPHGKIDYQALPKPGRERPPSALTLIVPPSNPIEEELVNIWKDILQIDEISVADNFFELGGHSLLATRLISRIRETFQIDLPLHVLFDAPFISPLADVISHYIIDQADDSLLEAALEELNDLLPEEIEMLLAGEELAPA